MPYLPMHQRSLAQQAWFNKNRVYKVVKDLYVLAKAGQCKGIMGRATIASEVKQMSSALTKSGAAHAKAIKCLQWKRSRPVPKAGERFTAIHTPKLAALYEQAVAEQKELVIEAISSCAAECTQLKNSLIESTKQLEVHQATFLGHAEKAEALVASLLSRSEQTGEIMEQQPAFSKWYS